MDELHYKPRRIGAGFQIEDTRTKTLVEGEEHDEFFASSQAASALERGEWATDVADRLEDVGDAQLARELREGMPRDVLLRRLDEQGEGSGAAAQILAQAPREP